MGERLQVIEVYCTTISSFMLFLFRYVMVWKMDEEDQRRARHLCEVLLCNPGDHIACLGRPQLGFTKNVSRKSR